MSYLWGIKNTMMKKYTLYLYLLLAVSCGSEPNSNGIPADTPETKGVEVVLFAMNDMHGKIDRFSKVKPIIDAAKASADKVFFVSAGDIFSGNPIVDFHPQKGSPMISLMNAVGLDVSVLGNHEFDYGQEVLNQRMSQASFPFICANVNTSQGVLNTPAPYVVIEKEGFKIAFIGALENSSKGNLPLSHPKNMDGLSFESGAQAVASFESHPDIQTADLVVALTHYGKEGDIALIDRASNSGTSFVDLVVGGHNHMLYNETYRKVPMIQTGAHMKYLAKLTLSVASGVVQSYDYELIDLSTDLEEDPNIAAQIADYNNRPEFYTTLATAAHDHSGSETGCFYTTAIKQSTQSQLAIQNYGGIRATIKEGPIRPYDVYTIDPFGNGLETYSVSVGVLKEFFSNSFSMAYSGLDISKENGELRIRQSPGGPVLADSTHIKIAVNDYISNLNEGVFVDLIDRYELTTADYLISYLKAQQAAISNEGCDRSID
mgnify:FL=1